jgi:hypothetical protein
MNPNRSRRERSRLRLCLSRLVAASLTAALTCACVSTTSSSISRKGSDGPWLEPSPALRAQIEDKAKRLPWTHGLERVELIQWFAGVGEPAYPTLLQLVLDPRPDVSGAALAALGATRDSRLVEPLRAIPPAKGAGGADLALERARTLLRLGDWQSVPDLIAGLRDDRPITRALCAQALYEATHERFDFDPRGEPQVREDSVRRWETWWQTRQSDPLLPKKS